MCRRHGNNIKNAGLRIAGIVVVADLVKVKLHCGAKSKLIAGGNIVSIEYGHAVFFANGKSVHGVGEVALLAVKVCESARLSIAKPPYILIIIIITVCERKITIVN